MCRAFNDYLVLFAIFGFSVIGCTSQTAGYCDKNQPCPAGQRCNLTTFSCEPTAGADAGRDVDGAVSEGGSSKGLGASCGDKTECESGSCVDGVCCASDCTGTCRTCKGSAPGQCELVASGSDPRDDCAGSVAACSGSCDGAGACSYPDDLTSCGNVSCSGGQLSQGACDSAGGCTQSQTLCNGYACNAAGDGCKTSCSGASDCTGTFQCIGNACVNQLPNGQPCGTNDSACASGSCVDGICCGSASCAACNRCDIAGKQGACAPVSDGTTCGAVKCDGAGTSTLTPTCTSGACGDVAASCGTYTCNDTATPKACRAACNAQGDCAPGSYCDANKSCVAKKQNGAGCSDAVECSSNVCVQEGGSGVCCDRACGGAAKPCEACKLTGKVGTCSFRPAGTQCGAADVCVDNVTTRSSAVTRNVCSGSAAGCTPSTVPCASGFGCNTPKTACLTSCSGHAQCWQLLCDFWDIHGRSGKCAPTADICHVDGASGGGTGTYADPFDTIQKCLDTGRKYVRVVDGTYTENLVVKAPVALVATSSPAGAWNIVYTGKVIVRAAGAQAALRAQGTQIAGTNKRALVYGMQFTSPTSQAAQQLVEVDSARLDLYTVGVHNSLSSCVAVSGSSGALYARDFTANSCSDGVRGEAIATIDLENVLLFTHGAYGVYVDSASTSFRARDLAVAFSGAGVQVYGATPLDLDRVTVHHSSNAGVALENGALGSVTNLLSFRNGGAGVVVSSSGALDVANATVAYNSGGAEVICSASARFVNTIVWGQGADAVGPGCNFEYSDVKSSVILQPGTGNTGANPAFTDVSADDFTLTAGSPCVNTGSDTGGSIGASVIRALDVVNKPRKNGVIDMGAYERQ